MHDAWKRAHSQHDVARIAAEETHPADAAEVDVRLGALVVILVALEEVTFLDAETCVQIRVVAFVGATNVVEQVHARSGRSESFADVLAPEGVGSFRFTVGNAHVAVVVRHEEELRGALDDVDARDAAEEESEALLEDSAVARRPLDDERSHLVLDGERRGFLPNGMKTGGVEEERVALAAVVLGILLAVALVVRSQ